MSAYLVSVGAGVSGVYRVSGGVGISGFSCCWSVSGLSWSWSISSTSGAGVSGVYLVSAGAGVSGVHLLSAGAGVSAVCTHSTLQILQHQLKPDKYRHVHPQDQLKIQRNELIRSKRIEFPSNKCLMTSDRGYD